MLTVACVLKSGGTYGPAHVSALCRRVRQFMPRFIRWRFVCLTDFDWGAFDEDLRRWAGFIPLLEGWPGWWSKIELFRAFDDGHRIIYFDLDTVIIGSLDDLVRARAPWIVLKDFYRQPPRQDPPGYGSGLMAWNSDQLRGLYDAFRRNPERFMTIHSRIGAGDQGFLEAEAPAPTFWQDLVPGQVVSYKVHVRGGSVPAGTRIICFHGKPKPWETELWPQTPTSRAS